jgi:hypothetical protein
MHYLQSNTLPQVVKTLRFGIIIIIIIAKSKTIPITGHGGLYGCEMFSIPYCLDSWLTDGGEFANLTRRIYFTFSSTHFC